MRERKNGLQPFLISTFSSGGNKTDNGTETTIINCRHYSNICARIRTRQPFPYLELKGPIVCSTSARNTSLERSKSYFVHHVPPGSTPPENRPEERSEARRGATAKGQQSNDMLDVLTETRGGGGGSTEICHDAIRSVLWLQSNPCWRKSQFRDIHPPSPKSVGHRTHGDHLSPRFPSCLSCCTRSKGQHHTIQQRVLNRNPPHLV